MAVDLGEKERKLQELFEELGESDLEKQIKIMREMGKNPQMALPKKETEVVDAEIEI